MRIAFDLDGVLAETSIALLRTVDRLGKEVARDVYGWTFRENKMLLNPMDFMIFSEDEYYIITSREEVAREITEKWVRKYCPHVKELIMLDDDIPDKNAGEKEIFAWLDRMANSKAKVINEKKIEVYFDDSSWIVKKLRELCPNCKVINYGGRI